MDATRRGIVDQTALGMREATFAAGVWLTYIVCGASGVYVACTWGQPHRLLIACVFGLGAVGGLLVSLLPRGRIVRSRYREAFFLSWSILDLVLITVATVADGGAGSPLALIYFVPVVFAAMSYPLWSVTAVGGLTVVIYMAVAGASGGSSWSHRALFAVMLSCTGVMSAWMARNQERQREVLTEVSRIDPLTGCLNRRGFEERADVEIAAAARRRHELAVMLLDVDHFKQVNDTYGHATGDELLCWVVATLGVSVRVTDAVGRLGGDEFAVLFAQTDAAAAAELATRIAATLAKRAPCSVGVAQYPAHGTDLEALMRHADGLLYASRHHHRGATAKAHPRARRGAAPAPSAAGGR